MKALVTFKYTEEEFQKFKELGYDVNFVHESEVKNSPQIEDSEVLICFDPFSSLDISKLNKLKWIQLLSAGINQVPKDIIQEKGIILTNNRGGYSVPIAEWIVLKALEMIKNTKEFTRNQDNKLWKMDTSLLELYGKTFVFFGTGSIAKEAAKRLESFGVNILGINTSGNQVDHFNETYPVSKINEVVKKADFFVITAPYSDKTHHIIDGDLLDHMVKSPYFINISRGSIVDEKALTHALQTGRIKKAALDVFEVEPLPEASPLWTMDNVLVSPHNSWSSEMYHKRRFEIAYSNMNNYKNNLDLINVIDLNKGY